MQTNVTNQPSEAKAETPAAATLGDTFTLEVMKVVKEAQQQHGLRHADYQRYRSYCARRVRRLRKTLHFVNGNMRRYQKREIASGDELEDAKFLLIPLFQAERAWSYAMQLKQEANTEPRKKFHLVNRLRKAVKFASELEKLSQSSKFDARTKLEAQGYNSLINGQFYFELQKWVESLQHFNVAKKIYEKLSVALKGDESQVFYSQKVDEIIPNIRYCNYNLGDESAKKDLVDLKLKSTGSEIAESIDALIAQTKERQVQTFSELTWRNKIVLQIKNEKVKLFLLNVQEYEKQIQATSSSEAKISIYENILKESVDVIQIIRDELKLDQHFQTVQRGQALAPDDKPSNLLLLFSYMTWTRINKTIERNLLMIDSYKQQASGAGEENKPKVNKPQDIVRLYDIILQNLKDMSNLPGLSNDRLFLAETELLTTFYKTFRAYYISLFYLANKKYKEAVGFFFRVDTYRQAVETGLKSLDKASDLHKTKADMDAQLKVLVNELNQSKYKLQTAAILEDGSADAEAVGQKELERLARVPLSERVDVYLEDANLANKNPNVVRLPLSFEPIPCKPLFFDLAGNHVELPSYEDKIDSKKQAAQQQGVKGFIKGIFGFN